MCDVPLLVFKHVFEFKDSVCNGCHDLTILSVNISDIAIIAVKNVDYRCIIHKISKSEAINLLSNSVLKNRGDIYKKNVLNFNLLLRYVPDQYKTRRMYDQAIFENGETLKFVADCYKNQKMCNKAVDNYPHAVECVRKCYNNM